MFYHSREVATRDRSLRHQIVLDFAGHGIAVSCNCRYDSRGGGCYVPIAVRTRWDDPAELRWIYSMHVHEEATRQ